MDETVRKMFYPQKGDRLFQLDVKREVGEDLGNGWVCVGNKKNTDGTWSCELEYQAESVPLNKQR